MEQQPILPPHAEAQRQAETIMFHNRRYHHGAVGSDLEDCTRDSSLPEEYVCPYSTPPDVDYAEWYKNNPSA
jgi:hypothetical protein